MTQKQTLYTSAKVSQSSVSHRGFPLHGHTWPYYDILYLARSFWCNLVDSLGHLKQVSVANPTAVLKPANVNILPLFLSDLFGPIVVYSYCSLTSHKYDVKKITNSNSYHAWLKNHTSYNEKPGGTVSSFLRHTLLRETNSRVFKSY